MCASRATDFLMPVDVADVFASQLAKAELLTDGLVRLWFTSEAVSEHACVARIVMPLAAVPAAIAVAMDAMRAGADDSGDGQTSNSTH